MPDIFANANYPMRSACDHLALTNMYYKFLDSINSKEIGYHPQLKDTWPGGIDYWAPNNFANAPVEGLIEVDMVFPMFILQKDGNLKVVRFSGAGI